MKNFLSKVNIYNALIIILVLFSFFSTFYLFFKENYIIPPGDDCLRHMTIAENINKFHTTVQSNGSELSQGILDIPVFHIWLSSYSQITGVDIVNTAQYLVRYLLILINLTVFFVATKLFNSKKIGFFITLLLIIFSSTLSVIYAEGTYLDIYSAAFLLPLGLLYFSEFLQEKKSYLKYYILSQIFLLGVIWSHPLSAIGFFVILFFIHILLLINYKKIHFPWRKILYSDLIFLIALIPAWNYYVKDIFMKIFGLFNLIFIKHSSIANANADLNYIPIGFSMPPDFNTYLQYIGFFILYFGLAGICFFYFSKKISIYKKIIIFSWLLGLLVASRLSLIQLPIRYARDLFLPLAFFAGFFIYTFFEKIRKDITLYKISFYLFVILILLQFKNIPWGANDYIRETIRLQNPDKLAVDWINSHAKADDVLLGTPTIANPWGSFITLLTNKKVLGCEYDNIIEKPDDIKCSSIFNANIKEVKKYYQDNDISYVYGGKPFIGGYIWSNITNWNYYDHLTKIDYLEKVFDYRDGSGRVVIYKVIKNKL